MWTPRQLVCFVLSHRLGPAERLLGVEMRRCVRCDKVETVNGTRRARRGPGSGFKR